MSRSDAFDDIDWPDAWGTDLVGLLPEPSAPAPRPARRPSVQDIAITTVVLIALAALLVILLRPAQPQPSPRMPGELLRHLADPQPNAALPLPHYPLQKDDNDAR